MDKKIFAQNFCLYLNLWFKYLDFGLALDGEKLKPSDRIGDITMIHGLQFKISKILNF